MSTPSRVIRNTIYLYVKMGISIFVSLYSTRLILASLGASDLGIFNVVGGSIAMLGFLNSTMAGATQRFISIAEGEGSLFKKRTIFNVGIVLHAVIALATIILLLAAMFPLFNGVLNIAPERRSAAIIVYVSLIFSTVLTIINVPYDAVMNAHENMLYYSIVGILESLLKLAVAFICINSTGDKLVEYGILMSCLPLVTISIMKMYCHRNYEECVVNPKRYWDKSIAKQIFRFFSWNFLTAISRLVSLQGVSIVLNHFFGTVLNAAQGIANQVNGVLSQFSENLRKPLRPVITKDAGSKNITAMNRTAFAGCKFSSLITLFFGIPICLEVNCILDLWLMDVPEWTASFVVLQSILCIIIQISGSVATAIYAQGDIKHYTIWKSITDIIPIIITWIAFCIGGGALWLYIPMVVFCGVAGDVVIVSYAKKKCGMDVLSYIKDVVLPIVETALVMLLCGLCPILFIKESFLRLVITCLATSIGMLASYLTFAVTAEERQRISSIFHHLS